MESIDLRIAKAFPFKEGDGHLVVFAAYSGSVSHGTSSPTMIGVDDIDITGAVIPPIASVIGWNRFDQWDPRPDENSELGPFDCTFYNFIKFIKMVEKGNPNVAPLLWLHPDHYILLSKPMRAILTNRRLFISKQCIPPIRGYALGQLRDIDKAVYRGYMGAARKASVDKHGYDVKHAAHTVRILRLGIELCEQARYNVYRGDIDASELISIKSGEWRREQVLGLVDNEIRRLDDAFAKTKLDEYPQSDAIAKMMTNLYLDHIGVIERQTFR